MNSIQNIILKQFTEDPIETPAQQPELSNESSNPSQSNRSNTETTLITPDAAEMFDDEAYVDSSIHNNTSNPKISDQLEKYEFNSDNLVTYKAARLSGKVKSPYAIVKTIDKRSKIAEIDTIYRTDHKMKYNEYKHNVRIGFIKASEKLKYEKLEPEDISKGKFVGIVGDRHLIYKKKPFNHKHVGYIKIEENTVAEDYFVEVVKPHNPFAWIPYIMIPLAILIILFTFNWESLHSVFNTDDLKNIGKNVADTLTVDFTVLHEGTVVADSGIIYPNIVTTEVKGAKYKALIYIGDTKVYESEPIETGKSIDSIHIPILENLEPGTYTSHLVCQLQDQLGIKLMEMDGIMNIIIPDPNEQSGSTEPIE